VPGIKRVIASHGYLLPLRKPGTAVQKGRALLVGDAAGLVEAFTGEGIYWAIRSGQIAAHSILESKGEPDYQRRLDATLMPDLVSARRWMHVYFWAPRACYILPKRLPFFWAAVCRIVRGEKHFSDIGKWLGPLSFMERALPWSLGLSKGT
jgi:flavin-dependent dehydrogenase